MFKQYNIVVALVLAIVAVQCVSSQQQTFGNYYSYINDTQCESNIGSIVSFLYSGCVDTSGFPTPFSQSAKLVYQSGTIDLITYDYYESCQGSGNMMNWALGCNALGDYDSYSGDFVKENAASNMPAGTYIAWVSYENKQTCETPLGMVAYVSGITNPTGEPGQTFSYSCDSDGQISRTLCNHGKCQTVPIPSEECDNGLSIQCVSN